jgi:hypothetical protein
MHRNSAIRSSAFSIVACTAVLLSGCGTIQTTANVVKTGASVVGSTVSATTAVASTAADIGLKSASTAASVGSATIAAGAAARTATAATASVAIAGATALGGAVKWGIEFARSEELQHAPIIAEGANAFLSKEGSRVVTLGCDESRANEPALLVINRRGEYLVRTRATEGAKECAVVSINEQKSSQ